jgi:hypothetical protein
MTERKAGQQLDHVDATSLTRAELLSAKPPTWWISSARRRAAVRWPPRSERASWRQSVSHAHADTCFQPAEADRLAVAVPTLIVIYPKKRHTRQEEPSRG